MITSYAWADVAINAANFPDDNFRSYVSSNFDTDSDGILSDSEIANVTQIDVYSMNISSLTGVEYVTALTYLSCNNNQLTALNVSNCTALMRLDCSNDNIIESIYSGGTVRTSSLPSRISWNYSAGKYVMTVNLDLSQAEVISTGGNSRRSDLESAAEVVFSGHSSISG